MDFCANYLQFLMLSFKRGRGEDGETSRKHTDGNTEGFILILILLCKSCPTSKKFRMKVAWPFSLGYIRVDLNF